MQTRKSGGERVNTSNCIILMHQGWQAKHSNQHHPLIIHDKLPDLTPKVVHVVEQGGYQALKTVSQEEEQQEMFVLIN